MLGGTKGAGTHFSLSVTGATVRPIFGLVNNRSEDTAMRFYFATDIPDHDGRHKVPANLTQFLMTKALGCKAHEVAFTDTETGDDELIDYAEQSWDYTIARIRCRDWYYIRDMLFCDTKTSSRSFLMMYLPLWAKVITLGVHIKIRTGYWVHRMKHPRAKARLGRDIHLEGIGVIPW